MAINSKQKGKKGELELAKALRQYGYDVRRSVQYNGKAEEGQPIDYYTNNKISVERTAKKYSFDGWYTDRNFENKVTNLEFTYGTINLYAKWKDDSTENETVEVDYLVQNEYLV